MEYNWAKSVKDKSNTRSPELIMNFLYEMHNLICNDGCIFGAYTNSGSTCAKQKYSALLIREMQRWGVKSRGALGFLGIVTSCTQWPILVSEYKSRGWGESNISWMSRSLCRWPCVTDNIRAFETDAASIIKAAHNATHARSREPASYIQLKTNYEHPPVL